MNPILGLTSYDEFLAHHKSTLRQLKLNSIRLGGQASEELRLTIQHLGALFNARHPLTLLEWATGVGKSRSALLAAQRIGGRGLIVHKQLVHIKTWQDEIVKWGIEGLDFEYTTYESLKKRSDVQYDWVIYDEVHAITPRRIKSFADIQTRHTIMLSATVPYEKRILLKKVYGQYQRLVISLGEAIAWRLLPPITLVMLPSRLTTEQTHNYPIKFRKSWPWLEIGYQQYENMLETCALQGAEVGAPFKRGERLRMLSYTSMYNLTVRCDQEQYHQLLSDEIKWKMRMASILHAKGEDTRWLSVQIKMLGSKRKRYLSVLKMPSVQELTEELRGLRYVTFVDDIEQAAQLSEYQVHSKKTKEENLEMVRRFNDREIDQLSSVKMLNESMNLVDLDAAIILSLNGVDIANIQRIGRSVRGAQPLVIIVYVPGTRDHENMMRLTSQITEDLDRVSRDLGIEPRECVVQGQLGQIKHLLR